MWPSYGYGFGHSYWWCSGNDEFWWVEWHVIPLFVLKAWVSFKAFVMRILRTRAPKLAGFLSEEEIAI